MIHVHDDIIYYTHIYSIPVNILIYYYIYNS